MAHLAFHPPDVQCRIPKPDSGVRAMGLSLSQRQPQRDAYYRTSGYGCVAWDRTDEKYRGVETGFFVPSRKNSAILSLRPSYSRVILLPCRSEPTRTPLLRS